MVSETWIFSKFESITYTNRYIVLHIDGLRITLAYEFVINLKECWCFASIIKSLDVILVKYFVLVVGGRGGLRSLVVGSFTWTLRAWCSRL